MKLAYIYLFLILSFTNISRQSILLRITDLSEKNSYIFEEKGLSITGNTINEITEEQKWFGITHEKKRKEVKPDDQLKHNGIIPYVSWEGKEKPDNGVYSIELTRTPSPNSKPVFKFKYIVDGNMYDNQYLFKQNDKWGLMAHFVLNFKGRY
jgi:hypothetical protein